MGKNKHPFTVVYVYAPEQYKDAYMRGRQIPQVKIGETGADSDDCKSCMDIAMRRINQQSTGFKEYMYLLQWFVFPFKRNTDVAIRKILTEEIYHKTSSKRLDAVRSKTKKTDDRTTNIGQDFAYDISIAQVNTAVSVYKLKSKMEELINDRGIDPTFKKRLKIMIGQLLNSLDEVVDESAQTSNMLPVAEQKKIFMQEHFEMTEPTF